MINYLEQVNYARREFALIQQDTEILPLLKFLKKEEINSFIEIGSHKGGSFYLLSQLCSGIKISIDLCSGCFGGIGPIEAEKRNTKLKGLFDNCHFIEGDTKSRNTWLRLDAILGDNKVDLLFIDGDHTLEGVKNDWDNYRGFVKPGGLVVFHDIIDTEFHRGFTPPTVVCELWSELKKTEQCTELICLPELRSWDGGGIGIVKLANHD